MPPPADHFNKTGPEAVRLSMWTVLGAVAASVLTAGILGGASGILQVPGMVTEINALRTSRDQASVTIASISERLRSAELVAENEQRQLNDISLRQTNGITRMDKSDYDARQFDVETQKELAALEGRSKDRNTEVKGDLGTLKSSVDGQGDRIKALGEQINILRQNLYDLAAHGYKAPASAPQPFPGTPEMPTYHPPLDRNGGTPSVPDRRLRDASSGVRAQP
jgi:hypothetical protein